MAGNQPKAGASDSLDQLIAIGSKIGSLIGTWQPGITIGIDLVKLLIKKWNERQAGQGGPTITVSDDELIRRVEERSARIVQINQSALDRWVLEALE